MKFRESRVIILGVSVFTLLVLALPLVLYAWIGIHSRYMADDFWTAGHLKSLGFWEAQRYWYLSWSGRFSFTFLVSLVELLGVKAVPWMPLLTLLIWWIGLCWLFTEALKLTRLVDYKLLRLLFATLTLYATLRSLEFWQQVILWQTGILTYTLPLVALTFWFAWFLRQISQPETYCWRDARHLLTVTWFWFFGGLSETTLAMQVSLLSMLILAFQLLTSNKNYRREAQSLLGAALVGSFLALLVMGVAPGNAVRAGQRAHAELWDLISGSFYIARYFLQRWIFHHIRPAACALVLPGMAAFFFHPRSTEGHSNRKITSQEGKILFVFLLTFAAIYWSCFIPAYYIMRSGPPHRAMVGPQFLIVITALIGSYLIGLLAQRFLRTLYKSQSVRLLAAIVLVGLLCIGPVQAAWRLWHGLPQFQQFSIEWDIRDQLLQDAHNSGIRRVIVPPVRDLYVLGDVTSSEEDWISQIVAQYYGVEAVLVPPPP